MQARGLLAWLLGQRLSQPATDSQAAAADRATQMADDEAITAALQARTLRRGRVRVEHDPHEMVRRSTPPRGNG